MIRIYSHSDKGPSLSGHIWRVCCLSPAGDSAQAWSDVARVGVSAQPAVCLNGLPYIW